MGKIKETDQLAYEETAKTLELYSLPKRGYRVNAIQFYQTAEGLNRVNTADTAMLQLQDKQWNHYYDSLKHKTKLIFSEQLVHF